MATTNKTENKVVFNLKNVHYAVANDSGYATPKAIAGAVSITLDAQGDITPFYADGVVYQQSVTNNGYEGDLEIARIPDAMLQEVWGYKLGTTSKVLTENSSIEAKSFALLFQFDGDSDNELYVLYSCKGTRPSISGATSTETKEVKTATISIKAIPDANGNIFAKTTADTPEATRTGWFTTVFKETT